MCLPAIIINTQDLKFARLKGSEALPAGIASMIVVLALVSLQLFLQVGRCPKQGLIHYLPSYAADQTLNKGM